VTLLFDTAETTHNITISDIRAQTALASGIDESKLYLILRYIFIWGPAGPENNLNLIDITYGTQAIDNGAQVERVRVGFKYPKQIQNVLYPGETSHALFGVDSNAQIKCECRIGVTAWSLN